MTAVHELIEEAELGGAVMVPLARLKTAVARDTHALRAADETGRAAVAHAIRNHRPTCPEHGERGCERLDAMRAERDRLADYVTGLEALSA